MKNRSITIKDCTVTVVPDTQTMLEKRADAVVALSAALKANAEALGKAADALRGPENHAIGIKVDGAK